MNKLFQEEKNRTKENIAALEKRFVRISWGRVGFFIAAIIFLSFGISRGKGLLLLAAAAAFICFLVLVSLHGHVSLSLQDEKTRDTVIDSYIQRMGSGWKNFQDDGSDLMGEKDHASIDLDIAGPSSLYQLLHICHTEEGRKLFYAALQPPELLPSHVDERRKAIRELSEKFSFLCALESVTIRITSKMKKKRSIFAEQEQDRETEKSGKNGFPGWMQLMRFLIPLVQLLLIVTTVMGITSPGLLVISFLVCLVITLTPGDSVLEMMLPVFRFGQSAKDLIGLLELIGKEDFSSMILSDMKEKITRKGGILSAAAQMRRIGQAQSLSYNTIIHLLLNGFLAWDFHVGYAAYKWNEKNGELYRECMEVIASFEELGSFAVLPIVRNTCSPAISREAAGCIRSEGVYHPLLSVDTVVANNVDFGAPVTIITGSNMSGKTTLMRTLALNLCLMYAGADVCAETFSAGFFRLFTSMRIRDDVTGGISTFYAEILRIKEMADYVEKGGDVPALCMIDEIFKGTNSADRIAGAEEAIRTLSSGNCMVVVTTHDFELCDMKTADGKDAENYHFEEYYEGDAIRFDYTIREGRCTTRNARALLTLAGLFHG